MISRVKDSYLSQAWSRAALRGRRKSMAMQLVFPEADNHVKGNLDESTRRVKRLQASSEATHWLSSCIQALKFQLCATARSADHFQTL